MSKPAEELIEFLRSADVGCAFARHLARDPDGEGFQQLIVPKEVEDGDLQVLLDALLNPGPRIAVAIFPYVTTSEHLAKLLKQISRLESWRLELVDINSETLSGIAVRWQMPDEAHESWVLGFAPFDHMPTTRRAPHVAIVLKADSAEQPFLKRKPSEITGLRPIHLADLPFDGLVDHFAKTWKATSQLRRHILEGELDQAARAKVTFTIPTELQPDLDVVGA